MIITFLNLINSLDIAKIDGEKHYFQVALSVKKKH